ncbi:hypothetical protein [Alloalcanivorax xenomutans]
MIRRGVIASQAQAAPGPDGTYTFDYFSSSSSVYDSEDSDPGGTTLEWYPTNVKPALSNAAMDPLAETPEGADYSALMAFTSSLMTNAQATLTVPADGANVGVTDTATGEVLLYQWHFQPCFIAYDLDYNYLGGFDNLADCMALAPPILNISVGTLVAETGNTLGNPYITVDGEPSPPPAAGVIHPMMSFSDGMTPYKVFQIPNVDLLLDGYVPPPSCLFPLSATQQTIDTYFNGQGQLATITDEYSQSFAAPISVVASDTTYYATTVDGPNTRLPTALKTSAIEVAITLPEHPDGAGTQDIAFVAQTVLANTSIEDLVATISAIRYEDGTASLVVSIPGESLQTFPLTGSSWVLGIVIADGAGTFDLYLDGVDLGLTGASISVEPWLYLALGLRAANTLDGGQITMGFRTADEQFAHTYGAAGTVCEAPPPVPNYADTMADYGPGSMASIEVIRQYSITDGGQYADTMTDYGPGNMSTVEVVRRESLIIGGEYSDTMTDYGPGSIVSIEVVRTQEIE